MVINDWVHVVAGSLILLTLALGADIPANPLFVSRYWLLFTAFVGANLLQFGFSTFCPLGQSWKNWVYRNTEPAGTFRYTPTNRMARLSETLVARIAACGADNRVRPQADRRPNTRESTPRLP